MDVSWLSRCFKLHTNPFNDIGQEYIYNGITAYKRKIGDDTLQSFVDEYISKRKSYNEIIKLEKVREQTNYGESIVVVYTSVINNIEYKSIRQHYLHNDTLYIVSFSAKSNFFDFFVNEAIHMMKTFTITE